MSDGEVGASTATLHLVNRPRVASLFHLGPANSDIARLRLEAVVRLMSVKRPPPRSDLGERGFQVEGARRCEMVAESSRVREGKARPTGSPMAVGIADSAVRNLPTTQRSLSDLATEVAELGPTGGSFGGWLFC